MQVFGACFNVVYSPDFELKVLLSIFTKTYYLWMLLTEYSETNHHLWIHEYNSMMDVTQIWYSGTIILNNHLSSWIQNESLYTAMQAKSETFFLQVNTPSVFFLNVSRRITEVLCCFLLQTEILFRISKDMASNLSGQAFDTVWLTPTNLDDTKEL